MSLPIALLLGLKREAVGACHSINRETNLALMQDVFGPDSPEARGSLSIYIIGGIYLALFVGIPLCNWLYAKLEPKLGPIHDKLAGKGKGEK